MTAALLENSSEFVEFLIDQELVDMSTYLDVGTLNQLYNDVDDASTLNRTMKFYGVSMREPTTSLTSAALMTTTGNILAGDTNASNDTNKMLDMLLKRKKKQTQKEWTNLPTVRRLLKKILGSFDNPLYLAVTVSSCEGPNFSSN